MNISPRFYVNNYSSSPAFRANNRQAYNTQTNMPYKTTTYLFRADLNWDGLTTILNDTYKNTPKVHIYNDACSSGHEPVSLAIKLKENLGKNSEKFFPIKASDYDSENIKSAKSWTLGVKDADLYELNRNPQNNYYKYLQFTKAINPQDDIAFMPNAEIRENIQYNQGDIFKNIEKMPSSNTVLLCRNFWRYLPKEGNSAEKLAQKLGEKFDSTCMVVIGEHDRECNTKELLEKNGFRETGVQFVFKKCTDSLKKIYR